MPKPKKLPSGKYRARYRDDARIEHARHFDTQRDAQQWLDEVTASIVTGTYVDPRAGRVAFGQFFEQWAKRQLWAPGTDRAMRLAVASTTFRDVSLRELRLSHLESWVKIMATKERGHGRAPGLAPGTIKTRVNNVRSVLRGAVRDRVIAVDPSEGLTIPRARRAEAAMRIPRSDEVGALLTSADDYFAAFLGVAAFAGLRLGEAAGLQIGDVDFLNRRLNVERQVQRLPGGGVDIRRPKFSSERTVYSPTICSNCCHVTSRTMSIAPACLPGCFEGNLDIRRTRTLSATGGARPAGQPASKPSPSMTSATTSPRG